MATWVPCNINLDYKLTKSTHFHEVSNSPDKAEKNIRIMIRFQKYMRFGGSLLFSRLVD